MNLWIYLTLAFKLSTSWLICKALTMFFLLKILELIWEQLVIITFFGNFNFRNSLNSCSTTKKIFDFQAKTCILLAMHSCDLAIFYTHLWYVVNWIYLALAFKLSTWWLICKALTLWLRGATSRLLANSFMYTVYWRIIPLGSSGVFLKLIKKVIINKNIKQSQLL